MNNLAMAVFWGLFGILLIVYHAATGDERGRIVFLGNISSGWAGLLICVYNLARWWNSRIVFAAKQAAIIERARREREARTGSRSPYGDPNPDFQFGDESPPPRS